MAHFFYSLITFFVALFFILLGMIGILLPWSPSMKELLLNFLNNYSGLTFLFGLSFLAIGIAVALNILLSGRRSYYYLKVKNHQVSIDAELLQKQLQKFLKEILPEQEIPCRLQLKHNQIYITLEFPYVNPEEQKRLLEKVGKELKNFFVSLIDYQEPFHLSASFQEPSQ